MADLLNGLNEIKNGSVNSLNEDPEYKKGYEYALRRLARRECSVEELRRKIIESGISLATAERIVDRLLKNSFVSDERFSRMLIRQQANRANGPRLIQQKLKARGIDLTKEQLKEISSEVADLSERETARRFLERKYPLCWEDQKIALRASQALLRRGFSYSFIQDVLRRTNHED